MTGRQQRSSSPRPFRRISAVRVLCTVAAGASLVSGCGVLPGGPGGSREPVTVMTWAPEGTPATNMPGMPAMAKAFARWVNAAGGIDGHELRVLTCNERNTSSGAADCARLAADKNVTAVVGSYSQHGNAFMAPLEAAGIPYLGGYGVAEREFSSFVSYPVNGGQAALLAGNGMQLGGQCGPVSIVRPDTITGDAMPELLNSGLSKGKNDGDDTSGKATDIRAAEDATDYTASAERARENAATAQDGCVTAVLGDRTETFFDSYRRLPDTGSGEDVRISSVLGSVGQPLVDRTGGSKGVFEGAYVTGWYPQAKDPAWRPMREVIQKHAFDDTSIDPADPGVQTTWIAYTALKSVIESIDRDTVSSGTLSHALDKGAKVETGGLTPTLRWRYEDMLGSPGYPRIVNSEVTFQVVRDGELVALKDGFVDVRGTLSDAGRSA
ncbi:ABC transporter substrate-binding protein [Streptomyces niveus]|uniref:ABC transporter substrate-binding protein n=1 Tax=Streptomyces niveus TaxID=193462 RepID=A0ABZ2A6X5_STRNV|nr:ABC transporter substrate-binding protein [Streptomyces niveus]WTA59745.1 ABC transporter substrate-binding protein [Streptomyces niveus]